MKAIFLRLLAFCCASAALVWSEPAHAAPTGAGCTVVDVATFDNRVHIHCTPPVTASSFKPCPGGCPQGGPNAPTYVAVEATSPMASNVVLVGLSALINKRDVYIWYDNNVSANPAGCNANDCRRLIGVVIQ